MSEIHPELRRAARWIPRFTFTPALARFARFAQRLRGTPRPPAVPGITIRDHVIPGPATNPALRVRLYTPDAVPAPRPAMLWMHGGGFIIGTPEQDQANLIDWCRELGMIVAAVAYRIGPEHPYPAGLDDAYAALQWLHGDAAGLGVDAARIVVGGNSAGAGLAAGLVLAAHDRGEVPIAFQFLVYPMLDDRTTRRTDIDQSSLRLWNSRSNLLGWRSYLGYEPGSGNVPDYAAPARRSDLAGLPPTWIGVGTCDLFHDEDVTYAHRLDAVGVPCTLKVVEGAFHGFDLVGQQARIVREFRESALIALRNSLAH